MTLLLGLTWAFGATLLVNSFSAELHTIFEYVFIVLEGLQGIFFFIAIVFLNEEVH